jgi:hypothetical protein
MEVFLMNFENEMAEAQIEERLRLPKTSEIQISTAT